MDLNDAKTHNHELVPHKGFKLISGTHDPEDVDQIYNLEIRDSDVFVVTYPKSGERNIEMEDSCCTHTEEAPGFAAGSITYTVVSSVTQWECTKGTIWMQQILLLLEMKGDVTAISKLNKFSNADLIPWIEVNGNRQAFITAPSPRLRVTHLQHQFMPPALSQRGKVIYVARNPKDVLVSYFYFHKLANMLETPKDFDEFFEKFMRGDVFGCSWFDHVKTWFSHKDDMNMLFITYEEMIQDLQSAVERISSFLGKELTDEQLANVVKHSTFKNMKKIPQANYEQVPGDLLNHHQGRFMRKGTIGDWKNHFTVAQNEMFDKVFHKEMKDFPLSFIWDIRNME
ncbi:amine sulfotransferase-like isoform X1 [Seriola aureovittata]|uniref:amine sulfotransferase-like isoform X1 n=1 Tax=Seriola aureovittata TaxID=2871759 RepID=UPI0024BEE45A|nr:amine sulfotransferase-like isoform X1 [Seriola aureovittata]